MFLLFEGKIEKKMFETGEKGKWGMWPVVKYKGKEERKLCHESRDDSLR
jgi:hypothetical protein